jgi:HPt (histidine-containing phosphotransfer) domain-containing protein
MGDPISPRRHKAIPTGLSSRTPHARLPHRSLPHPDFRRASARGSLPVSAGRLERTAEARHAAERGGDPVVDVDILRDLRDMGGEDAFVAEIVQLFLEDTTRRLPDLERALAEGRVADVAREAHTLKSASSNLGATAFSSACAELETLARGGDCGGLVEGVQRVLAMFAEVEEAFAPWMDAEGEER